MNRKYLFVMIPVILVIVMGLMSFFWPQRDGIVPAEYATIPAGKVNVKGEIISMPSFYMSRYEVSNKEYNEFLTALKVTHKKEELEKAKVDGAQWKNVAGSASVFNKFYDTHEAYADYPVVNISYDAAVLYCEWLTEEYARRNGGKTTVEFRLPTEKEWVYAAKAGQEGAAYPWEGKELTDKKGRKQCNFKSFGDELIRRNPETNRIEVITEDKFSTASKTFTSPVNAYTQNDFDLYNMSGNVAEFLQERGSTKGGSWNSVGYDVRIEAEDEFVGTDYPTPFVGFRPVAVKKKF